MPTARSRSTGKAAPTKGAASAVSATDPKTTATADEKVVVTQADGLDAAQDTPITVDAAEPPNEAERELLREAAAGDIAAQRAADQLGVPYNEGIPNAARLPLDSLPKITEGVEGQVGAIEQPSAEQMGMTSTRTVPEAAHPQDGAMPVVRDHTVPVTPPRDLAALRALADVSGYDPVTPYPADDIPAPNPLDLLPEPRSVQNWCRDTDTPLTGRVTPDGWRVQVNGAFQFAMRGDRITAPDDIMRAAESQGVVIIEED